MDTVIFTIISATNGMQTHQNVPDSRFLNIWDIVKAQMRRMLSNKPIPDLLECGTNISLSMLGVLCKFRNGIRHWRVVGRLSLTGDVVQGPWESRGVEHVGGLPRMRSRTQGICRTCAVACRLCLQLLAYSLTVRGALVDDE
ncbi:hypothetical protein ARMGADRAFT_218452 [Armillaria gallica]|uniref:Uncharacterized protein n=1 Tax=Armillaria gallica TaxID=47427 RepID=A0A2H3DAP5_ARMGA|nr:hypothetical protein ARMGADRAFT_218452 [Armillaria gallica]